MNCTTLGVIHDAYQVALERSSNLLEIAENLYEVLNELDESIIDEDLGAFDSFLDGLRGCIQSRKKTFEVINITNDVIIVLMYIILWMNSTKNMGIDIEWVARCKSLESELTKLLKKSSGNLSASIRDRFGIKGVVWNQLKEEEVEKIVREIFNAISGILAGKNRNMKSQFENWIKCNQSIMRRDKVRIEEILKIPFGIDYLKDYIQNPKDNGYKTLQFTMTIQMYSEELPGCQFEIQLRTKRMDEEAEHGSANHEIYKKTGGHSVDELSEEELMLNRVFNVDDFSKINIVGFKGYAKDEDINGIHFARVYTNRRISTTLVPSN